MAGHVVVVGSLSVDFVMRVPRRPEKGETISGFDFNTFVGGKGNNQALAAARAGANVHMVGRVGQDSYGEKLAETLKKDGVSTKFLFRDATVGTGIANIYVDPQGDNSIVIIAQSNGRLSKADVDAAGEVIKNASVLMLQLEVPIETVIAAAALAHKAGVRVMLNPAPAPPSGKLPDELWPNIDLVIPNQTEAELLTGIKVDDEAGAKKAAEALKKMGAKEVIITMGEHGAFTFDAKGNTSFVPAFKVTAIDTTAAGDAFCGALAASLASGAALPEAVRVGCAAGGLATTKAGAEPSLPAKKDIDGLLDSLAEPLKNR
jgi:ribokinase